MATKFKVLNLNENILVKLNEKGFELWKQHDDLVFAKPQLQQYQKPIEYYRQQADINWYVKFQLWQFMQIFGGHSVFMGMIPPYEMDIFIPTSSFKNPP